MGQKSLDETQRRQTRLMHETTPGDLKTDSGARDTVDQLFAVVGYRPREGGESPHQVR